MNKELVLLLFILGAVVSREVRSCNSCGIECENACGTRNFRACCLNYVKKRSTLSEPFPLAMDPSLRLELWLAKSRNPYYQRNFDETILSLERQPEQTSSSS